MNKYVASSNTYMREHLMRVKTLLNQMLYLVETSINSILDTSFILKGKILQCLLGKSFPMNTDIFLHPYGKYFPISSPKDTRFSNVLVSWEIISQ